MSLDGGGPTAADAGVNLSVEAKTPPAVAGDNGNSTEVTPTTSTRMSMSERLRLAERDPAKLAEQSTETPPAATALSTDPVADADERRDNPDAELHSKLETAELADSPDESGVAEAETADTLTTPETPEELRDRAHSLAERIITKKTKQILKTVEGSSKSKKPSELSPGDRALFDAEVLGRGFPDETYVAKPNGILLNEKGGGLKTKAADGTDVTVIAVAGQKQKDGDLYYDCITDLANPTKTTEVSAVDLKNSHLSTHSEDIGKTFTDPAEAALATWHAEGEANETPSSDKVAAVETKLNANPFLRADEMIASQITLIEASLIAEGKPDEEKQTKNKLLTELRLAEVATGDIGKLLKINTLKRAATGPNMANNIGEVLEDLEPQRQEIQESINHMLDASGQPKDKIEAWKKLVSDPDGLYKLLSDPDFAKLPDMSKEIFGKDLTNMEAANVDKLIDDFAKAHFTPDEISKLKAAGKWTVGHSGWILAILLAIPTAALAGATLAATGALSSSTHR